MMNKREKTIRFARLKEDGDGINHVGKAIG
jgi:hypothetical protein